MVTMEILSNLIGGDRFSKLYRIRLTNGKSIIKKMWATKGGYPVIAKPKSRRYGWLVDDSDLRQWDSVVLYEPKKMTLAFYETRVKKAISMLENSGLWVSIKKDLDYFMAMPKSERQQMLDDILEDSYHLFYHQTHNEGKYGWVQWFQMFESMASKKCWRYPRYTYMHNKEYLEQNFAQAKANNVRFTERWTNGYDVTYSVDFTQEEKRGWLSDEYVGCGNGHYYLLLDATHAIYFEDD